MKKFSSEEIKEFVSKPNFDEKVILAKDSSWPKISIITPSYNQAEFLERAILSVLNQNYPNLEYIIIDGGSTDGSVEIIKKYEKYLAYWVSEKDNGQADALNKGFSKSTGEILFYLNSDDVLLPGVLEKVSYVFKKRKEIDLVYGNKLLISPDDDIVSERRVTKWIPYLSKIGVFSKAGFGIYLDAAFYKRSLYEKTEGFSLSLRNTLDTDMFFQMLNFSEKFYFLREYIIGFRLHKQSKTVSSGQDIGVKETSYLLSKYSPYKPSYLRLFKYFFRLMWMGLFIIQGDIDYLFKRIFIERLKNYQHYEL